MDEKIALITSYKNRNNHYYFLFKAMGENAVDNKALKGDGGRSDEAIGLSFLFVGDL